MSVLMWLYSATNTKIINANKDVGLQEQSDRLLVMYPSTLIILSEESDGLFYKVPVTFHP